MVNNRYSYNEKIMSCDSTDSKTSIQEKKAKQGLEPYYVPCAFISTANASLDSPEFSRGGPR